MDYKRIFIEKKREFNIESEKLYEEFKKYLGIDRLKDVRVVNIYDVVGLEDSETRDIIDRVIYEPKVDILYEELPIGEGERAFRIQYLKGQFNKREYFTTEIIEDFVLDREVEILHSKMIILKDIDEYDFKKIRSYYINPVEMKEIPLDVFTYERELDNAGEVEIVEGFIELDQEKMESLRTKYGIAMDIEDLILCQGYFKEKKRNPTITEIRLIDTYWSDHCRHTTFMTEISDIDIHEGKYKELFESILKEYLNSRDFVYENRKKPVCLMDLATINMKEIKKKGLLEDKEESDEVNAASIEIDVDVDGKIERWLLMFKNETHNHPTEMEPFGGAATCLGGAIRDPLSGRAFVYQAMRITGAADPRQKFEDTLPGKLPQRKITQTAMEGYSSYGNEIGAATGYVREIYDEGFLAKRMECGALVAAAPKEWVYRGKSEPGDVIILVGGRTGRDGLGGAVGSSKEHTEESLNTSGAEVQKGNPALERKIIRLFRKENVSKMIKVCNDFGAGGVGVAIGELADGLDIQLDRVPLKYPGLDGTEIALSESQERMAVVIDRENLDKFMKEAQDEDLEATVVAEVTEEKILKMSWRGKEIVNIDREFLNTNGMRKKIKVQIEQPIEEDYIDRISTEFEHKPIRDGIFKLLSDLNIGSQKGLVQNFDSTVGGGTVLMPYGGEYGLSPSEGMVAKIPVVKGNTNTCSIMTYGYEPKISKWSPFHGGYYAVIDSIAKVVALGGDYRRARLTFQEYFERLGQDEIKWGKPLSALLGAYKVQKELDIPSIGGKDSMSGTFEDIHVPPTLISFAVTSEDVDNIISSEFKEVDSNIVLMPLEIDDDGLIDLDKLKFNYSKIKELVDKHIIAAAQSVKYGGIARAILEMSFGNKIGFKFNDIDRKQLFMPMFGSLILEIPKDVNLQELLHDVDYKVLGQTIDEEKIYIEDEIMDIDELITAWESSLKDIFPVGDNYSIEEGISYTGGNKIKSHSSIAKPKVLIPIFTGTHGEYTMAKAFEEAGGDVDIFVFKSLNREYIQESYRELASRIEKSQIIGFPHGAIFGNEPEVGGKLLKIILSSPYVKEEIDRHLNLRDGLILGVGNGLEGLMKSELIAGGDVVYNRSGRFISTMVDIEVKSNLSPWMSGMDIGYRYTVPLAAMEGRIILDNEKETVESGQVATQFLDYNPTGSILGIESLTSKDGRVLGTISSIDRLDEGLYKNIDIKGRHNIFESGVKYFK
ncbi:MAG: phosphoribosylformylglycinamidine synthase [Tissierellaceae bacterium]